MKIITTVAFLLASTYLVFQPTVAQNYEFKYPITLSHRGANKVADENTIEAYEFAMRYGMNFIECDPRLTADGELVIMHDATLDRTTNGTGNVADKTLSDIKQLRTKNGYEIPTFADVLALAHKHGAKVFIDTKLYDDEYLSRVVALVREYDMANEVIVGLWTDGGLRWLNRNHPDIAANLPWPAPVPSMRQIKKMGSSWVGMLVESATDEVIAEAHSVKLRVVTMPINDAAVIADKLKAGMHVIQTDNPALLDATLGALSWAHQQGIDPAPLLPSKIRNAMPSIADRQKIAKELPPGFVLVPRLVFITGHIGPPDAIAIKPGRARMGDGSFDNPTTLAVNPNSDSRSIPYGSMIYIPDFGWTIAEDYCGKCVEEGAMRHRVDLWLGNNTDKEKAFELTGWHWVMFAETE